MEALLPALLTVSADSILESAECQFREWEISVQAKMWYRHESIRRGNSHLERANIPGEAIKACFPDYAGYENPDGTVRKCDDGSRHLGLARYILELSSNQSMTRQPAKHREQYILIPSRSIC